MLPALTQHAAGITGRVRQLMGNLRDEVRRLTLACLCCLSRDVAIDADCDGHH
jgi:hypothetical protein